MSLRYVHVFFIALSVALAVGLTAWGFRAYVEPTGEAWHLLLAVVSFLAAFTLWIYAVEFVRKARRIGLR
jgi:hypothetical protein